VIFTLKPTNALPVPAFDSFSLACLPEADVLPRSKRILFIAPQYRNALFFHDASFYRMDTTFATSRVLPDAAYHAQ